MWRQGFWRGLQFLWWRVRVKLLFRLYAYDKEWDNYLLALLATETFTKHGSSKHIAVLGEQCIWIANHPYASFMKWDDYEKASGCPSMFTLFLAEEKFVKETGRMPT